MKELVHIPMFKGQNGWTAEGWRNITNKFNDMFSTTHFTEQQVHEKVEELKGNYKIIKETRKKPKGWEKLIRDNHKVAKFHKKLFPLYNSLELLYEGSVATEDLNFTSIEPPPQRKQSNHSMASIDRNPLNFDLGGVESIEVQSALASRNSDDQNVTSGKKRKQSQVAAKLGNYINFRKDQIEKTLEKLEEKKRCEEDYSIEKCIDIVDAMEGLSDEQKADANEVFQSETNR
ncbi:hypothetical protein SETIT_4G176200v2 [Setaria italica]|uniref:Myb/SANT-like domain-containing protein n=1 Tax=Setaria italica TaxID=4555 RepID=A0A368QVB8_SETIT|nr:hypothetical protein SETIT_4G176200v2 [Setaria italica]